ncbi:TPA: hypothetical protein ACJGTR_004485 [Salmonella enterica subsp. enterica serovar Hvittingfoss]|nr:hypothetical protein [Salmonella enterica]EHO8673554.1 hypothetical protein [Salmonella enterica]HEC8061831.1 hypothetical protein [Salmonella enterica subsp. enterica serovar Potsdam]
MESVTTGRRYGKTLRKMWDKKLQRLIPGQESNSSTLVLIGVSGFIGLMAIHVARFSGREQHMRLLSMAVLLEVRMIFSARG